MAIAQRFNVGGGELSVAKVPKGRLNAWVFYINPYHHRVNLSLTSSLRTNLVMTILSQR